MPAILTEQLTKHFPPDIEAVNGIDLSIEKGRIFGFLGQNGSGKTTTVRMLTTLLRPTDRKSTRLNSSHVQPSRMPSSA